jgi:hypothetical protein
MIEVVVDRRAAKRRLASTASFPKCPVARRLGPSGGAPECQVTIAPKSRTDQARPLRHDWRSSKTVQNVDEFSMGAR